MKKWLETAAIPFIERWWRPLAILIGVVLALLIGKRILGRVVDAIMGKVTNGSPFQKIDGDPTHVIVPTVGGPQVVRLPTGVTSDQVQSVGYAPGYLAKVEVKSGAVDRRS